MSAANPLQITGGLPVTDPENPYVAPWVQLGLIPPDVLEIHLRLGVVPASQHLQWLLEVQSATDGVLLGLVSTPHVDLGHWQRELVQVFAEVTRALAAVVEPF